MVSFFRTRWRGAAPLPVVFWRDMLLVGTLINVASALVAMAMFISDWATPVAAVIYFAAIPYNLFLFASVWRSAGRTPSPASSLAQIAAAVWLVLVVVL